MKSKDGKVLSRSEAEAYIKSRAAISISVMAALLAILSLISNANSGKVLNNTITANNLWSWYQAKNVRQILYETAAMEAPAAKKTHLLSEAQRMDKEKRDIADQARALEVEREHARKRSPWYTYAGSLLQIGVVLTTAAILAATMTLFWAGASAGLLGALSFANGYWLFLVL